MEINDMFLGWCFNHVYPSQVYLQMKYTLSIVQVPIQVSSPLRDLLWSCNLNNTLLRQPVTHSSSPMFSFLCSMHCILKLFICLQSSPLECKRVSVKMCLIFCGIPSAYNRAWHTANAQYMFTEWTYYYLSHENITRVFFLECDKMVPKFMVNIHATWSKISLKRIKTARLQWQILKHILKLQ